LLLFGLWLSLVELEYQLVYLLVLVDLLQFLGVGDVDMLESLAFFHLVLVAELVAMWASFEHVETQFEMWVLFDH
jgi:hypothetical protein